MDHLSLFSLANRRLLKVRFSVWNLKFMKNANQHWLKFFFSLRRNIGGKLLYLPWKKTKEKSCYICCENSNSCFFCQRGGGLVNKNGVSSFYFHGCYPFYFCMFMWLLMVLFITFPTRDPMLLKWFMWLKAIRWGGSCFSWWKSMHEVEITTTTTGHRW